MKTTVLSQQSLFDIAIQTTGDASAAFELAVANGISITDELETGQELTPVNMAVKEITGYYANRRLKPATGLTEMEIPIDGIDFMGIEIDFIIR